MPELIQYPIGGTDFSPAAAPVTQPTSGWDGAEGYKPGGRRTQQIAQDGFLELPAVAVDTALPDYRSYRKCQRHELSETIFHIPSVVPVVGWDGAFSQERPRLPKRQLHNIDQSSYSPIQLGLEHVNAPNAMANIWPNRWRIDAVDQSIYDSIRVYGGWDSTNAPDSRPVQLYWRQMGVVYENTFDPGVFLVPYGWDPATHDTPQKRRFIQSHIDCAIYADTVGDWQYDYVTYAKRKFQRDVLLDLDFRKFSGSEFIVQYYSGLTVYAIVVNESSEVYHNPTPGFEPFNVDHWATYARPMSEVGSTGVYLGDFPTIAADNYAISIYAQIDASPNVSDTGLAYYPLRWNGSQAVSVAVTSVSSGN